MTKDRPEWVEVLTDSIWKELKDQAWEANKDEPIGAELIRTDDMISLTEVRSQILADHDRVHTKEHWLDQLKELDFEPELKL